MSYCYKCGWGGEDDERFRIDHADKVLTYDRFFCPDCNCVRYIVKVKGDTKEIEKLLKKEVDRKTASTAHRGEVMKGNWEKWKAEGRKVGRQKKDAIPDANEPA